jgi:hypothetical protein
MGNSDLNPGEMKNLIIKLMTEFAFLIDLHYEDEEIARLANEDKTFRVFHRAVQWMEENDIKQSRLVKHLMKRIFLCHYDYLGELLHDPEISI